MSHKARLRRVALEGEGQSVEEIFTLLVHSRQVRANGAEGVSAAGR